MYTASNYFWGLVAYYLGALVVIWYIYWLLRKIPYRHVRNSLGLMFVALLFTPVQAYQGAELAHLAPAFLVYLFEGLVFASSQDPERALMPMLFVLLVLMALYIGWEWWRFQRRKQVAGDDSEREGSPEFDKSAEVDKDSEQSVTVRPEAQPGSGSA